MPALVEPEVSNSTSFDVSQSSYDAQRKEIQSVVEQVEKQRTAGMLPVVKGESILLKDIPYPEKIGSVVIPGARRGDEAAAQMAQLVVGIGPMAWAGECERRCEVGDFVAVRPYMGVPICVDGVNYRFFNAGSILSLLPKPEYIVRGE